MSDMDLMTSPQSGQNAGELSAADVRPVPRISIQAFCEQANTSQAVERCFEDRRMARTHMNVHMGGLPAAVEFYQNSPTPNVIVVECGPSIEQLFEGLEELAAVCDQDTKVVVIGHTNDVELYRRLMRLGIAEYMVAPFNHLEFIHMIGEMYSSDDAEPLGRVIAFIGAKGGVGSSTYCHNVAWSISSKYQSDSILADFDMAFGTVSLDFNQDPTQGISEAVTAGDDLDDMLLDRLLSKCTDRLSLLASPASVEKAVDLHADNFDRLIEIAQSTAPNVIIDLPNTWNDWIAKSLSIADEVVVTAAPDLANLRNAKNILDHLKSTRSADKEPNLILSQVGRSKETEIKPADFENALETTASMIVPYEPKLFGMAANNGQMIVETDGRHGLVSDFDMFAASITGRSEIQPVKSGLNIPFLSKIRPAKKRAS